MSPDEPINEPCPISPTFVDGLSAMQTIGAVTHLGAFRADYYLYVPGLERIVQARLLILPTDQLQAIRQGVALRPRHADHRY